MTIPRDGMTQASQSHIAPNTDFEVQNKSVLPTKREFKWYKKGIPYSILNPYPNTPPCEYGTLAEDNGSGKIPPEEPKVIRG